MRIIKPEFWSDEKISRISILSRLTYIGLWNLSDDYGVVKGSPVWIKGQLFPYDDGEPNSSSIRRVLVELEMCDKIRFFECNGEVFYYIPKFLKHQKIDRKSQTKNPEPPREVVEGSTSARLSLDSIIVNSEVESEDGKGIELPASPDFEIQSEPEVDYDQIRMDGIRLGQIAFVRRWKGCEREAQQVTSLIWNQYRPYNVTAEMFRWIIEAKLIPHCSSPRHCYAYGNKIGDEKGAHVSEARKFLPVAD